MALIDGVYSFFPNSHVGAAAESLHAELVSQLKAPGRMFIPVNDGIGQAIFVVDKDKDGGVTKKKTMDVWVRPFCGLEKCGWKGLCRSAFPNDSFHPCMLIVCAVDGRQHTIRTRSLTLLPCSYGLLGISQSQQKKKSFGATWLSSLFLYYQWYHAHSRTGLSLANGSMNKGVVC
jgi:hypothetical protein